MRRKLAAVFVVGMISVGAMLLMGQSKKAPPCPDQCQSQINELKQQVVQLQQQGLKTSISATPSFSNIGDGNKGDRILWSAPAGSKIVFAVVTLTEFHIPPEKTTKIQDKIAVTSPSARGRFEAFAWPVPPATGCSYLFTTKGNEITWSQENCIYPTGGDVYFKVDSIYQ